jgi:ABC-2 type transport system ATP-binding protein
MIEVENIGKRYGPLEAVKGVSFHISAGEVVGLLGPNGAGKTTIMRILTCYLFPSYGTARLNGHDVAAEPLEVKRSLGYLPENAPLYTDLNVMESLEFIAESHRLGAPEKARRIDSVIEECGLGEVVYRSIDRLSKGYKQRTGLAQAIIHQPEILILDEPTTGLDPNQIIEIRELIKRLGREKTVILSTHILQEVEATCGRVMILNEGKIAAKGTTEEIWREMKGETLIKLRLRGEGDPGGSLAKINGVREILDLKSEAEGEYRVQLSLAQDAENAAERIFDWAVKRGYKILAMIPERLSLESIFIQLTREGDVHDVHDVQ